MAPEQWPEIKNILAAALELEGQERVEYLERTCADRPALRSEVESLIASYEEAGDFLERPVLEPPPGTEDILGRRIGPYRIEEMIGKGGMGAVYRAVRADSEFRQQVAIKLIKPGMDTGFILKRFRHERQILAALDHPNIAKLLDGGTTEDGLPYFVMEYIPGLPIDQYCDKHRLDTSERLNLFLAVCSAVHYAHQKKVIHRDLKPHNILITAGGVPKLLDFGIAKILDPDLATGTLDVTATVLRLMTPEYASPEQVRGEPVTAASDVYSLGVLLYEILTGHRPYRLKSRSAYEMMQVICEGEPPRPSTAVGKTEVVTQGETVVTVTPEVVSETREGDPIKLRRRLAGDLDNIVLMALRKEPKRRYASVEALAEDIRRHLRGVPVRARGETVVYAAARFMQRHRAPLITGLIVATVLMGAMTWFSAPDLSTAVTSAKARRSVAVLGFRNLSERAEWAWLSTALTEMLLGELAAGEKLRAVAAEGSERARAAIAETAGKDMSRQGLERVRQEIGADYVVYGSYLVVNAAGGPQIRLDVRAQESVSGELIANVHESGAEADLLKMIARAGMQLREQLGITATRPDASLPANAVAARYYSQGMARLRTFDTLAARDALMRAVAEDPNYPLAHSALALALVSLGNDQQATEHARKAFELSGRLSREERLFIEGRYYETARAWDKAIEIYRQLWTAFPDMPEYGLRLASTLIPGGQAKEALQVVAELRKLPHSDAGDPRVDLAEADAATASSDFVRAQAAAARAASHPAAAQSPILVARAKLVEARALAELGELARSASVAEESQELYAREKHDRGTAQALSVTAAALAQQGKLDEAKDRHERALAISRTVGSQAGVANALDAIGAIYRQYGRFAVARQFHNQALGIRRSSGDRGGLAISLLSMGNLFQEEGLLQQARQNYEESIEIRRALGQRRGVARVQVQLANALRKLGEIGEAESICRQALTTLEEVGDLSSAGQAILMLAQVLYDRGEFAQARQHFQRALDLKRKVGDRSSAAAALYGLGRVALAEGKLDEARRCFEESFVLRHEIQELIQEAVTRLGLAELSIHEQRPGAGELLARQSVGDFHSQRIHDKEAWAHAVLGRTLLADGRIREAQASIGRSLALEPKIEMVQIRAAVEIAAAEVEAASGKTREAEQRLERARTGLRNLGVLSWEREARTAMP